MRTLQADNHREETIMVMLKSFLAAAFFFTLYWPARSPMPRSSPNCKRRRRKCTAKTATRRCFCVRP